MINLQEIQKQISLKLQNCFFVEKLIVIFDHWMCSKKYDVSSHTKRTYNGDLRFI